MTSQTGQTMSHLIQSVWVRTERDLMILKLSRFSDERQKLDITRLLLKSTNLERQQIHSSYR